MPAVAEALTQTKNAMDNLPGDDLIRYLNKSRVLILYSTEVCNGECDKSVVHVCGLMANTYIFLSEDTVR